MVRKWRWLGCKIGEDAKVGIEGVEAKLRIEWLIEFQKRRYELGSVKWSDCDRDGIWSPLAYKSPTLSISRDGCTKILFIYSNWLNI
jgi:hypothetical protein